MATRIRDFTPERIYFITYTIYRWKNIFISEKYFNLIYKWFDYMKEHYDNNIHGYVIMPNYLLLLLYVSNHSPLVDCTVYRQSPGKSSGDSDGGY